MIKGENEKKEGEEVKKDKRSKLKTINLKKLKENLGDLAVKKLLLFVMNNPKINPEDIEIIENHNFDLSEFHLKFQEKK